MEGITTGLVIAAVFVGYFLPTLIAAHRKHLNQNPIFLVNLLFGWTAIGWIISLIWATTANTARSPQRA